jgi:hypothetical protein
MKIIRVFGVEILVFSHVRALKNQHGIIGFIVFDSLRIEKDL